MTKKPLKIFVDTSVFGGTFDSEFKRASEKFWDQVRQGDFQVYISPIVEQELMDGPKAVVDLYRSLIPMVAVLPFSEAALELKDAYLAAGILTERWTADALHVAYASVYECKMIISWNFKHIVNFRRIALYNAVNLKEGYSSLGIFSPQEVAPDEEGL